MELNQAKMTSYAYFLPILLGVFIFKGILWVAIFPMFQGPDEQIHYATIQYQSEPKEKTWPISKEPEIHDSHDIGTLQLSEEVIETAKRLQFDAVKWETHNRQNFSDTSAGPREAEIASNTWKRYIDHYPPNASDMTSLYYTIGTWIEKALNQQTIFTRFFAVRLFSVLLGVLTVWLIYLTARKINLSHPVVLSIATIAAFQPMFTQMTSVINIDSALIVSFSLFMYAGATLLKEGLSSQRLLLLLASIILGILSKGPGIVLAVVGVLLTGWLIAEKKKMSLKRFALSVLGAGLVVLVLLMLIKPDYVRSITNWQTASRFNSPIISLWEYSDSTLNTGAFSRTFDSYWGHFGWLDARLPDRVLGCIFLVEFVAWLGLAWLLIKHRKDWSAELPEKKYIVFFLGLMLALQLAIRFFDWRVFDATGKVLSGTPGRYFLPTISAHMILVTIGLSAWTRLPLITALQSKLPVMWGSHRIWEHLLKVLAALSILLWLYATLFVLIPRYYL